MNSHYYEWAIITRSSASVMGDWLPCWFLRDLGETSRPTGSHQSWCCSREERQLFIKVSFNLVYPHWSYWHRIIDCFLVTIESNGMSIKSNQLDSRKEFLLVIGVKFEIKLPISTRRCRYVKGLLKVGKIISELFSLLGFALHVK